MIVDQKEQYEKQGFIVWPEFLSKNQVAQVGALETQLRAQTTGTGAKEGFETLFFPNPAHRSDVVKSICTQTPHLNALQELVGDPLVLAAHDLVTKLPHQEEQHGEFAWHQDETYITFSPANDLVVWVALDPVHEQNGCLWVLPGSHAYGICGHKKFQEDHGPVAAQAIPLQAGDALIFSGLLQHRSLANQTTKPRRGLSMRFASAHAIMTSKGNKPVQEYEFCLPVGPA